jgi:hypothetical protein
VRRDDIHFSWNGGADLGRVDILERAAAGHEPLPLDIGVPEAAQLFLQPIDGIAIARRPLHAVSELRRTFNVRFIAFEVEAGDHGADRVCGLRRKRHSRYQHAQQEKHSN